MKLKNLWKAGMVLLLAGGLFFTGCSDGGGDDEKLKVTITGGNTSVAKNGEKAFEATGDDAGVTWSIDETDETKVTGTEIGDDGKLVIAAGETRTSFKVIATPTTAGITKGEVTVTVVAPVTDISISFDNADGDDWAEVAAVAKGKVYTFTATPTWHATVPDANKAAITATVAWSVDNVSVSATTKFGGTAGELTLDDNEAGTKGSGTDKDMTVIATIAGVEKKLDLTVKTNVVRSVEISDPATTIGNNGTVTGKSATIPAAKLSSLILTFTKTLIGEGASGYDDVTWAVAGTGKNASTAFDTTNKNKLAIADTETVDLTVTCTSDKDNTIKDTFTITITPTPAGD